MVMRIREAVDRAEIKYWCVFFNISNHFRDTVPNLYFFSIPLQRSVRESLLHTESTALHICHQVEVQNKASRIVVTVRRRNTNLPFIPSPSPIIPTTWAQNWKVSYSTLHAREVIYIWDNPARFTCQHRLGLQPQHFNRPIRDREISHVPNT